jgi:hypothetical protein
VLRLWRVRDWFDRKIAKSIASFEFVGSAIDEARRRKDETGVVGDKSPELLDFCSNRAET